MIDFNNGSFVKLKQTDTEKGYNVVHPLLIGGEQVLSAYKGIRDYVVFTNMRVISINVQGVTGKKKDFTSMPYSKISVSSIETSGVADIDSELEMWFSGLGKVHFDFTGRSDIIRIGQIIASYTLR